MYYKGYKLKETHSAYEIDLCKGAMNQCTKNIAFEYGKDNIRANVVAPGAVMTTFLTTFLESILVCFSYFFLGPYHYLRKSYLFWFLKQCLKELVNTFFLCLRWFGFLENNIIK